jgi:mannitol-1-/sugar-/sorbitol-6-/2-deoxyglucose-6-phosphatase
MKKEFTMDTSNIKAIIFDMDGTIVQTEHIWDNVILNFLKEKGISKFSQEQKELFDSLTGVGLDYACSKIKDAFTLVDHIDNIIARNLELADIMLANNVKFIDGFEIFHNKISKAKIKTGIATNAHQQTLSGIIKTMNLDKFFGNEMYCVSHVKNKAKPDPALFQYTLKKLNVKKEECIIFEDSLSGFQAAAAAGIKCIAIKNKENKKYLHLVNGAIENYFQAEDMLKNLEFKQQ